MKKYTLITCILACFFLIPAQAQEERNQGIIWSSLRGLEYEVKAGFSIGGTAPIPLPEEIRKITGYKPTTSFSIAGDITKWFGPAKKWGVVLGLRMETKGMETKARVKNYGMEIIGSGGEKLKGNWTGRVQTKVKNSYFSIPLLASCKLSPRWNLSAGPYVSYLINGGFSGYVYDGYLREGDPTGTKVIFEGDKQASYDFTEDLRRFQWGAQLGAELSLIHI